MKRTILSFAILGLLAASSPAGEIDYNTLNIPRFDPVRAPVYLFGDPVFYMEDFGDQLSNNGSAGPVGGQTYFSKGNVTWDSARSFDLYGTPVGVGDAAVVFTQGTIGTNFGTNGFSATTPSGDPRFTGNFLLIRNPSQELGNAPVTYTSGGSIGSPAGNYAYPPGSTSPGTEEMGTTLTIEGAPGARLSFSGRLLANGDLRGTDHLETNADNSGAYITDDPVGPDSLQVTISDSMGNVLKTYLYDFDNNDKANEGDDGTPGNWIQMVWDATATPNASNNGWAGSSSVGAGPDSIYEFDLEFANPGGGDLTIDFSVLGGYGGDFNNIEEFFALDDLLLQSVLTPEPSSMILFGCAVAGLGGAVFYRRRKNA